MRRCSYRAGQPSAPVQGSAIPGGRAGCGGAVGRFETGLDEMIAAEEIERKLGILGVAIVQRQLAQRIQKFNFGSSGKQL